MLLPISQCDRFFRLYDSLIDFANVRLDVQARTVDPRTGERDSVEQNKVARQLWNRPDIIDAFIAGNPARLPKGLLDIAETWKCVLSETFCFMVLSDGSAEFLFEDYAFCPLGFSREIGDMLSCDFGVARLAMLPFGNDVVYSSAIQEMPLSVGPTMQAQYEEWFAEAHSAGRVVRSGVQFTAIVPALVEKKRVREAQQLIEDVEYDLNPPTEFPGVHRGALADVPFEQREELIDAEAHRVARTGNNPMPTVEGVLRSHCLKGPVRRDLESLASTEKNVVLEDCVRKLGATRSSGLNKRALVASALELMEKRPAPVEKLMLGLGPYDFARLETLYNQGGSMTVVAANIDSLEHFPLPVPLFIYLFDEGETVTCVIPDETLDALKTLNWKAFEEYFNEAVQARKIAEMLVDTRGALTSDEAFAEYERIYPGSDSVIFKSSLLAYCLSDEAGFELLVEGSTREIYLVHWELIEGLEEEGAISPGYGVRHGELSFLENLFALREYKEPWALPEDMLQAGDYLTWAYTLPSAKALAQFLNENVPDGKNDYLFADAVMEEIAMHATGGVDPARFVQYLADEGESFEDMRHENELIGLLFTFINDLPAWENNGWPPTLLHARISGEPVFRNPDGSRMKVGRNDPCPCGSGKKYKKCCGR